MEKYNEFTSPTTFSFFEFFKCGWCFRDLWDKLHPLKPFAIDSAYYKLDIDSLMHSILPVSELKQQTYEVKIKTLNW